MNLIELARIASESLLVNKLRSILTMLGVIIGVGAVIALLTLGNAVQGVITDELEGLGSNLIFLFGGTNNPTTNEQVQPRLTNEDIAAIASPLNAPAVAMVAAEYSRRATVVAQGRRYDSLVAGVSATYAAVRSADVAAGRFLDQADVEQRARVAILGKRVYEALFAEGESPIGRRIQINGLAFRVIGVMEERGGSIASNEDDMVFIPLNTAQERLFPPPPDTIRPVEVSVAYIQSHDEASIDVAIEQVTALLRRRHNLTYQDNNFTMVTQQDLVSSFGIITGSITVFLGAIAAISLLVGGIGIMNIMLVSVTERTREIGLRKAVGARRSDILIQFLVEASALSMLGGVLGIFLGYALARAGAVALQQYASQARATVDLEAIVLATMTSIAVGVFFGLYPAVRAARLSPIDALRHE
jgi:putative ABC transport system permease protein